MRLGLFRNTLMLGTAYLGFQFLNKQNCFKTNSSTSLSLSLVTQRIAFADAASDDRPYLGCSLRSMNDSPGMMVLLVNTESPAWLAEMKVGDVLMEIEG